MGNKSFFFFLLLFITRSMVTAQPCTTLGQTPSTAFPVCGTTSFLQNNVPFCVSNSLFVPGCVGDGANYENRNPFFYKFTCYVTGSLGFAITPLQPNEDFDWQLYDITGRNPEDIFTVNSLVVTGNWAGTYGPTGASASGTTGIQCASAPTDNAPTFASMPTIIAGHEYLLMISHYTNTNAGYTLSFGGGTGVITDPAIPHMLTAKPSCDGNSISIKLNKKIRCNSLTSTGSEFSISGPGPGVISAATFTCTSGFDFDSLTIQLATPLTNGNYQLIINNGTDNTTLLDICGNAVPAGEAIPFSFFIPQPIFADSIGSFGCAPDSLKLYFPKKISCGSIAPDGSDFAISGPSAVTVTSAGGNCIDGKTDFVVIKLASPISTKGTYQLRLKAGNDGTVIIDECGQETPIQTLPFNAADTVSADFTYTALNGCQKNTLLFNHNGANDVTSWNWTFNQGAPVRTQSHTVEWPSSSSNTCELIVNNGVCADTSFQNIVLDNEVKASFTIPDIMCPEDQLVITNTSTGQVDTWQWSYDNVVIGSDKDPAPFLFPNNNNREIYRTVKLVAFNSSLNCRDSARKTVVVLNNCLIAVPTAFTPNNDGLNDYFWPTNALKAENLDFKVFNRWGQLIFHSRDWRRKWDGRVNGVMQGTGVFAWMLSYTHRDTGNKVFQKGTVTLIR